MCWGRIFGETRQIANLPTPPAIRARNSAEYTVDTPARSSIPNTAKTQEATRPTAQKTHSRQTGRVAEVAAGAVNKATAPETTPRTTSNKPPNETGVEPLGPPRYTKSEAETIAEEPKKTSTLDNFLYPNNGAVKATRAGMAASKSTKTRRGTDFAENMKAMLDTTWGTTRAQVEEFPNAARTDFGDLATRMETTKKPKK